MINVDDKFSKLFDEIEREYDELNEYISSVEIMSDHKLYNHYLSKISAIEDVAKKIKNLRCLENDYNALVDLKNQGENGLSNDIETLGASTKNLINEIKELIANKKQYEHEKISIEINSKEDPEFCDIISNIFETYSKDKKFEFEKETQSDGDIVLTIQGDGVFDQFKIFAGKTKRVQRGIETNALIVVLKRSKDEIEIDEKDLLVQTSKSSGAGGQHINKTESAVKITHVPTGIFAECQDERSQTKNKEKAMQALLKKLTQKQEEKAKNFEKKQRSELKSKIFGSTATIVFDYDLNKVVLNLNKAEYKLKEILRGELGLIINDSAN